MRCLFLLALCLNIANGSTLRGPVTTEVVSSSGFTHPGVFKAGAPIEGPKAVEGPKKVEGPKVPKAISAADSPKLAEGPKKAAETSKPKKDTTALLAEAPKEAAKPAPESAKEPASKGKQTYDHAGYTDDWHEEWRHGDFPSYKQTYGNAEHAQKYEDYQSDGKASKARPIH
eukprot:gnl/TRDRNA2_/TRDRNA2_36994_c0_seq1.p1 gnl/TRDRNA2_/TRDRNA2_36994_c0~~gnl/TRDRNA2_/TRDRNA2_36994_c0_seq1.p1  ORF type:complete len:172 (+),score=45.73 gnl/TRDRNA2_/TRDRNA2_36994_c0_seq1:62-577(+)